MRRLDVKRKPVRLPGRRAAGPRDDAAPADAPPQL